MRQSSWRMRWMPAIAFALIVVGRADVLPDDRSDILYHHFQGGGITVQGPSVLIRKKFGDSVSASYQYYLDMISSASIDVVSQASPYKERRVQQNADVDFLHNNTLYSAGYISSIEPDYNSKTAYLNVSQSLFGDLTTINFGYTQGSDAVGRVDKGVVQPLSRRRRPQELRRRPLSGADAQSAAGGELRDRLEQRLPAQPLSLGTLYRPDGAARLQLPTRALPRYAHQQCPHHCS